MRPWHFAGPSLVKTSLARTILAQPIHQGTKRSTLTKASDDGALTRGFHDPLTPEA